MQIVFPKQNTTQKCINVQLEQRTLELRFYTYKYISIKKKRPEGRHSEKKNCHNDSGNGNSHLTMRNHVQSIEAKPTGLTKTNQSEANIGKETRSFLYFQSVFVTTNNVNSSNRLSFYALSSTFCVNNYNILLNIQTKSDLKNPH